jgi:hypothetical protein
MFFELTGERWIGDVMPVNEPVGAVVYSMDTSNVDSVCVGGPARKQAGQLVGADLALIAEQAITSRVYVASKVAKGLGGERCR